MTFEEAVQHACIINHLDFDPADPQKTLHDLLAWETKVALDPLVSDRPGAQGRPGVATALPSPGGW